MIGLGHPRATTGSPKPQASKWSRWFTRALLGAPLLLLAERAWAWRWMSDDGFINLRVVQQLFAGHGPVFNPGERVEAATSPLWIGLLSAGHALVPIKLEWLAVVLGIALTLVGMAAAVKASVVIARINHPDKALLPVGALVLAVVPPVWEFASSGLEGGLGFAWLGICLLLLVAARQQPRIRWTAAFVIGLGPLIRPDFGIFSAAFLLALLMSKKFGVSREGSGLLATALALPVAYEAFRIGYYGALVPNAALAKEASWAWWSQGWRYFVDLVDRYWLGLPLLALIAGALVPLILELRRTDLGMARIIASFTGAGVLHGLYVVRVGGDFMHGRLLLPALFAIISPVAVVPIKWSRSIALLTVAWSLVCLTSLRPATQIEGVHNIVDARNDAFAFTRGNRNPVTLEDYSGKSSKAKPVGSGIFIQGDAPVAVNGRPVLLAPDAPRQIVLTFNAGAPSYGVDPSIYVVDLRGLGDAFTARLRVASRGRPGHEKVLPATWLAARYLRPGASLPDGLDVLLAAAARRPVDARLSHDDFQEQAEAGRKTLLCADVWNLNRATTDPLTLRLIVHNFLDAVPLYRLRIPPDPRRAFDSFCHAKRAKS